MVYQPGFVPELITGGSLFKGERISFQWVLIRGYAGVKNLSKENCCQLRKYIIKPPALYLQKGYGGICVDGCTADSGYNQLLMVVTPGSLHRCIPLGT